MNSLTLVNSRRFGLPVPEVKFEIVACRIEHIDGLAAFAKRAGVIL
jgi:hypothetical protein